jgi:hypothetical protein
MVLVFPSCHRTITKNPEAEGRVIQLAATGCQVQQHLPVLLMIFRFDGKTYALTIK